MTMQGARPGWGKGPGRYLGWLVITSAGVLALSGCDALASTPAADAQWGGICEDDRTGVRIDDRYCGDDYDDDGLGYYSTGYGGYTGPTRRMWYPAQYTGDVPAVGQRVTTGAVRTVPKGSSVADKGVPATGSSAKAGGMGSVVRRGGLGVSGANSASGAGSDSGLGKSGGS
jgi:hypothetical protein